MAAGRYQKGINEHFFDNESREMHYVLGAFYAKYMPLEKNGITFRSAHRNLVEIVKEQMKSNHAITYDTRGKSSYWFSIRGVPYLRSRLEEMGLSAKKEDRDFPEGIEKEHSSHFARGFIEAQALIGTYDEKKTEMNILFNRRFLLGLHKMLAEYVEIERDRPKNYMIRYSHRDCLKIHDFIYRDWDFIKERGLYLPQKKDLFMTDFDGDFIHRHQIEASGRIKEAERLLLEGKNAHEIFKEMGYGHYSSFARQFTRKTGFTISGYLKRNALKRKTGQTQQTAKGIA